MQLLMLPALINTSFAQTANEDFRKVNAAYSKHQSLSMNVTYTLYSNYSSTVAHDKQKGVYMRQGDKYYSRLLGVETMNNGKTIIVTDHNDKVMLVADPPQTQKSPTPLDIDSMLATCGETKYSETKAGQKVYSMSFDKRKYLEYSKVDIYINSQTWLIDKIVLYYREQVSLDPDNDNALKEAPRVEITYSSVITNPAFDKEQFSENKFIASAGGKLKATGAYAGFEVINQKIKKQ